MMEQVRFLSWNVYRDATSKEKEKLYADLLAELRTRNIDIVVLQECVGDNVQPLLTDYQELGPALSRKLPSPKGLRILLRRSTTMSVDHLNRYQPDRVLGVKLRLASGASFNVIGVHLYSKVKRTPYEQNNRNRNVPGLIREFESSALANTDRTLVVGDFNHAPFETIFSDPLLFNALNDKALIQLLGSRKYVGLDRPFFYNPMWNIMGDYFWRTHPQPASSKPGGSYFWQPPSADHYFWNLFDGVLLRPALMNNLDLPSLEVLTELNTQPLFEQVVGEGWQRNGYSDHLPLVFTLTF